MKSASTTASILTCMLVSISIYGNSPVSPRASVDPQRLSISAEGNSMSPKASRGFRKRPERSQKLPRSSPASAPVGSSAVLAGVAARTAMGLRCQRHMGPGLSGLRRAWRGRAARSAMGHCCRRGARGRPQGTQGLGMAMGLGKAGTGIYSQISADSSIV